MQIPLLFPGSRFQTILHTLVISTVTLEASWANRQSVDTFLECLLQPILSSLYEVLNSGWTLGVHSLFLSRGILWGNSGLVLRVLLYYCAFSELKTVGGSPLRTLGQSAKVGPTV